VGDRAAWSRVAVLVAATTLFPLGLRGGDLEPSAPFLHGGGLPAEVGKSVAAARARLREAACHAVFDAFTDADGRRLSERLSALNTNGSDYLSTIYFASGRNLSACQKATTAAFTEPGSRVVYLCDARFVALQHTDAARAIHLVIHEALHTLGLREKPPSSEEITAVVARSCGR